MTDVNVLNAILTGRYTIERELGAGGMAVVYLAHDLRHRRKVAMKVLRPELSAVIGAERFLREIETTARLQHPHILALHDSGIIEGTAFYVMPYVEGESLRDRLRRETQLPIDDAVRMAREVASALDYAHRHGVVHRDIKPENILLHDGQAFVADFGIALAVSSAGGGSRMTETGMSLGTPNYMSPEQAMGDREITPRSDVYALGCVLYEMLVGEPPFTGPSAQAVIARVVTEAPRSLTQQRRTVPDHVEAAVHKALEKLPADRFASAAEFSAALADASYTRANQLVRPGARRRAMREWLRDPRTLAAAGVAAILVLGAGLVGRSSAPAVGAHVLRVEIAIPDSMKGVFHHPVFSGPPAASPDGKMIAYSLASGDTNLLFIKYPDRFEPWPVPGGGRQPVFSPDGRWLAFHRDAAVWKIRVDGGDPIRIARMNEAAGWGLYGLAWHPNGTLFAATVRGLWSLPSGGGEAVLIRATDSTGSQLSWPSSAPDGRLLVGVQRGRTVRLALLTVDGKELRELPQQIEGPGWFVDEDILVFRRGNQRLAGRFDQRRLDLIGEPVAVSGISEQSSFGPTATWFSGSALGRLEPVWVTRSGAATPVGLPSAFYRHPRLSPNGSRLASYVQGSGLHVFDLATRGRMRLSGPDATEPVWTSDGRQIIASTALIASMTGLVMHAADASQKPDTLVPLSADETWPTDISRGDTLVAFYGPRGEDPMDVLVLNLRSRLVRRLEVPGGQRGARFSPDGQWLAYQSTENGPSEIVVQPWPSLNARYSVSPEGGDEPAWSRDGRELFFRQGDRMMIARVTPGPNFQASVPEELFRGNFLRDLWGDQSYDVAADGRFLMLRPASDSRVQVQVIYNWVTELRAKLAEANRK